MRAICFYSDRSDADWYKYNLELLVERVSDHGTSFEKHEYVSVAIAKDRAKPLVMVTHESGTGSLAINHWARSVEELVHDYQHGVHQRQNYQFVPVEEYTRLRKKVFDLIDQHKQTALRLSDYENAFEFPQTAQQLRGAQLRIQQSGAVTESGEAAK
jgi:hypothetical protein